VRGESPLVPIGKLTFVASNLILKKGGKVEDVCLEVLGVVETADASEYTYDEEVTRRRQYLVSLYTALPIYPSRAFWETVERADTPLEVLVRCLRNCHDEPGRQHLLCIIVQRTQTSNEYWVESVLKQVAVQADERSALMKDLYADLYESIIRALLDIKRRFWEENFSHCLAFERKHVFRAFMMREGRWKDAHVKRGERIPRELLARIELLDLQQNARFSLLNIEDERAQSMLHTVEHADLLRLVLHLPEKLKTVIVLVFWEGRSEKEIARLLGVTDRTVRNRMRQALNLLRNNWCI
jgi:RNA polymerase sigma factor (sigma-70 family)